MAVVPQPMPVPAAVPLMTPGRTTAMAPREARASASPLAGASAPPRPTPLAAAAPALPDPGSQRPVGAAPATTTAAKLPAAGPSSPPVRLPQLAELPEAMRREVGVLSPGGSVYAEQAAARMVILNGQVFREGDSLSADLRVELIRPRSVVFSLRGQRFELPL